MQSHDYGLLGTSFIGGQIGFPMPANNPVARLKALEEETMIV